MLIGKLKEASSIVQYKRKRRETGALKTREKKMNMSVKENVKLKINPGIKQNTNEIRDITKNTNSRNIEVRSSGKSYRQYFQQNQRFP